MAEQLNVRASAGYGGFWPRFLALLVDSAILFVAGAVLVVGLFLALGTAGVTLGSVLYSLGAMLYWPLMHASARQATFGKAMLGLKVTGYDAGRISILRSFGRELAKILSSMVFMLGFLIAAFTGKKQALHDYIASTYVVRDGPSHAMRAIAVAVAGFVLPVLAVPLLVGGAMIGAMMALMGQETKPPPHSKPPAARPAAPKPAPAPAVQAKAPAPAPAPQAKAAATTAPAAPTGAASSTSGQMARGIVVIPGTFTWDAESNALGVKEHADLWWQQQTDSERFLTPGKGAQIARLHGVAFESLSPALIAQAPFATQGIKGSDVGSLLEPGAVVVLRTVEGNLAKLRVIRYRNSHDIAFPGSENLREDWKRFVRGRPDRPNFHIELEYALYPAQPGPAAAPAAVVAVATAPASRPGVVQLAQSKPESKPQPKPRRKAESKKSSKPPAPAAAPQVIPLVINPRFNDLMTAVLYRDAGAVKELLSLGKWADKPDSNGTTPLIAAAYVGEAGIAEALLKAGANPNHQAPGSKESALSLARARNDQPMIGLLQRHGAR